MKKFKKAHEYKDEDHKDDYDTGICDIVAILILVAIGLSTLVFKLA